MSESPNYESDIEMVLVEEDDVPETDSKTLTSDKPFVNIGSKDPNEELVDFCSSDLEDDLDDIKGNNSPIDDYTLPKISVLSPSKLGIAKLDTTNVSELVDPPIQLEISRSFTPENASSTNNVSAVSDKEQSPIAKHPSPILYTGLKQTYPLSQVELEQDTIPEENESSNLDTTENAGEKCAIPEPIGFEAFQTVEDEFNAMSVDLNEDNKETDEMLNKAIKKRKKKLKKAMLAQKEEKSRKYLNSKEQSRRAQIKLNTAILRRLLPRGSCGSKHAVLLKSLDVIKRLRKRSLQYEMTVEKLMFKNYRLKRIVEDLQNVQEIADDNLLNEAALQSEYGVDEDTSDQLLLVSGVKLNREDDLEIEDVYEMNVNT